MTDWSSAPHLSYGDDGSLTLTVGGDAPGDPALGTNWLPAPAEGFSLFLRAYWPRPSITDGSWQPPAVLRG